MQNNTHPLKQNLKKNLENVSKEPSNALVMNIKTEPNIKHNFIVIFMLSYHSKSSMYTVQDTKRHPTVILTHSHLKTSSSLFSALFDDDVSSPVASWDRKVSIQ